MVACACEDGSLRLFDLSGERVTYLRSIQMFVLISSSTFRCKERLICCCWSKDGSTLVCGSCESHLYVFYMDTGRTESLHVNQTQNRKVIIWNVCFVSPSRYASFSVFTLSVVLGDSCGSVQIWDISKRIMLQNLKVHEGDVLALNVFSYLDKTEASSVISPRATTLILSGGMDAKVWLPSLHDA